MIALSLAVRTSMQLLRRIVTSAGRRVKWARIGVRKLRSAFHLDAVVVCGRRVKIAYPPWDVSNSETKMASLGIIAHGEGLGNKDGQTDFFTDGDTLTSTTKESNQGALPVVSHSTALGRIGSTVDLIKMDCEGAKWQPHEDVHSWRCIRYLALEYHLQRLGFAIAHLCEASNPNVGLIHTENHSLMTEAAMS